MTSDRQAQLGWPWGVSGGPPEFRWQIGGFVSTSLERQNSASSQSSGSTQTLVGQKVISPSWKPSHTADGWKPLPTPADCLQDLFGFGAQYESELETYQAGAPSSSNREAVGASLTRKVLPPTTLDSSYGAGSSSSLAVASNGEYATELAGRGVQSKGWISPYTLCQRFHFLSLQIEAATSSIDNAEQASSRQQEGVPTGPIGQSPLLVPETHEAESIKSREIFAIGKPGFKGHRILPLGALPRAPQPLADVVTISESHHPAIVSLPNAPTSTGLKPQFRPEDGFINFRYDNGAPKGLACPVCKLVLSTESYVPTGMRFYVHWRYLAEKTHLDQHVGDGHISNEQLREMKNLDRSQGLPAASTKILIDVTKYFQRAMIIAAPELRRFEGKLDAYVDRLLANKEDLGDQYDDFLAAFRSFKKRIRQEDIRRLGSRPENPSAAEISYVAGTLPEVQLNQELVAEPVLGGPGRSPSVRPFHASSAPPVAPIASEEIQVGSPEPALFQLQTASDASDTIDVFLEVVEQIGESANKLSSRGLLPEVVEGLRRLGSITLSSIRQVNGSQVKAPLQTVLQSSNRSGRPYKVTKPSQRLQAGPRRARITQPQARGPADALCSTAEVDLPDSLPQSNEPHLAKEHSSVREEDIQGTDPADPRSAPESSNVFSGTTAFTDSQSVEQNLMFTKPPYLGYDPYQEVNTGFDPQQSFDSEGLDTFLGFDLVDNDQTNTDPRNDG